MGVLDITRSFSCRRICLSPECVPSSPSLKAACQPSVPGRQIGTNAQTQMCALIGKLGSEF